MENLKIEQLAVDQLLHRGVHMKMRAPWFMRIIGKKTISLVVRSPYEGTMHRVAGYYLKTGIASDKLDSITHEEALGLMLAHGKTITKAVACAWLNGYWSGMLWTKPLARYMRWHCKPEEICKIAVMILLYGGTADFMNTTRSVRMMKLTAPRLGQMTEGS